MTWLIRTQEAHVTLFNPQGGSRVSFGPVPERLRAPELLDVKLTDVCSVGCAYCYQDSRPDRGHARLEDVALIAREAGKAGVFEVALGGGEVSEYPHFREALQLFHGAGVVPNFTTRRMRWLSRHWPEFRELVGGVAVSVNSAAEVRLLGSLIPATERREGQLVVQVVMGTVERFELLALVQEAGAAGIRVTLLGFKDAGRGQSFKPLDYGWWLDDLRGYVQHAQISIDTALASETPDELAELLLPGSYHTEEGRFSAYVDAVNMTLAPSSYHAGPVHPFDADWLDAFASADFVQGPKTPEVTTPLHVLSRVRLGFATNSSSSHSLVLLKEPVPDDPADPSAWREAFGTKWGTFVAATAEAKKHYLAANLVRSAEYLYPGQPWESQQAHILALCDLPPGTDLQGYDVDHQSAISFALNPIWPGPHAGQVERMKTVLFSPNVAVCGHGDSEGLLESLDQSAQQQVRFELDGADFYQMLATPGALEPAPQQMPGEDDPLYLLGVVRGERLEQVVSDALQAGFSWAEVNAALFENEDTRVSRLMTDEGQQNTLLARLFRAIHLPVHPSVRRDDQRLDWLHLYVRHDAGPVNALLTALETHRDALPEFAGTVWDYAAQYPHRLTALQRAVQDMPHFAATVGTEEWGRYLRINEYLERGRELN